MPGGAGFLPSTVLVNSGTIQNPANLPRGVSRQNPRPVQEAQVANPFGSFG